MTLQSMTGFARGEGAIGRFRWVWEIRSVNGKGLDLRLRLPAGHERLEPEARTRISGQFSRGNMQASLSVTAEAGGVLPVINEEALAAVLALVETLKSRVEAAPLSLDGLLNVRGIVDMREPEDDEGTRDALDAAVLGGLDATLRQLQEARGAEGAALRVVLTGHLDEIERIVRAVDADPARSPQAIRERLAAQVALLADDPVLDAQRLHTEAALLAAKADLREELDRLKAHIDAGRTLLAKGGPVGRRLDFLAQEFNRESNTICSKSNAASVTALGLDLKVVVDQLREQVQNLE